MLQKTCGAPRWIAVENAFYFYCARCFFRKALGIPTPVFTKKKKQKNAQQQTASSFYASSTSMHTIKQQQGPKKLSL